MKSLVYSFAFIIPLILIFIGLYTDNQPALKSGFSLFLFIYLAFVGSSIAELKQVKIDSARLKIVFLLFAFSIASILLGAYFDKIVYGSAAAFLLGVGACFWLLGKK